MLLYLVMKSWQQDLEDMKFKPNDLAPGELKEKLKRMLIAGRSCSCVDKNCFAFVNAPPDIVSHLSGPSNQYCGLATPSASDR